MKDDNPKSIKIRLNRDNIIDYQRRVRKAFYDIQSLVHFSGFGERRPIIYITSFGRVIVEYEDVEVDILLLLEYLNEDGVLTKENWHKAIINNP